MRYLLQFKQRPCCAIPADKKGWPDAILLSRNRKRWCGQPTRWYYRTLTGMRMPLCPKHMDQLKTQRKGTKP